MQGHGHGQDQWLRPDGGRERPAREWHWWTVCVPGLLALAVSGFLMVVAFVASVMSCFDTCESPRPGMSAGAVGAGEFFVALAAIVLLVAGLAQPVWRRFVAAALWAAIALAIGFVALH